MARDRKRAKQRQRRRQQQQARPQERPGGVADDEIVHDAHEDEPNASPDPLAHASADVDIAELAEASVREPGAPDGPLAEDEYPHLDETEGADAIQEDRAQVQAATGRPGAELPREGNRFVNFLRACVAELGRVQWPDRRHVGQATGVVLGFVVIAGSYLGLLDAVFSRLMEAIL